MQLRARHLLKRLGDHPAHLRFEIGKVAALVIEANHRCVDFWKMRVTHAQSHFKQAVILVSTQLLNEPERVKEVDCVGDLTQGVRAERRIAQEGNRFMHFMDARADGRRGRDSHLS